MKENTSKSFYLHKTSIKPLCYNTHFTTVLAFIFQVYFMTLLKLALLGSDLYTCFKLLAFNQWSNSYIKPYISFRISKWLYSSCILVSVVIIVLKLFQSWRLMRRTDNIITIYMNMISRQYYSFQKYSNFCIFNKISPSNYLEKLTFYVFFQLNNNYTLLLGDTPRQVINGLTLWSVLISRGDLKHVDNLSGIISKISYIATNKNYDEAVILSVMLGSFIIWLFFFACFVIALCCYPYVSCRLRDIGHKSLRKFIVATIYTNLNKTIKQSGFEIEQNCGIQRNVNDEETSFEVDSTSKYGNIVKERVIDKTGAASSVTAYSYNDDMYRDADNENDYKIVNDRNDRNDRNDYKNANDKELGLYGVTSRGCSGDDVDIESAMQILEHHPHYQPPSHVITPCKVYFDRNSKDLS